MTAFRLPAPLRDHLAPATAAHIENYKPTLLTSAEWLRVQSPVCELAARTLPGSGPDAQQTLSVVCRYLQWTPAHLGSQDIATVFAAPHIERFLVDLKMQLAPASRQAYRVRLRTCLR